VISKAWLQKKSGNELQKSNVFPVLIPLTAAFFGTLGFAQNIFEKFCAASKEDYGSTSRNFRGWTKIFIAS
jgi:hypothetical protein